MSYQPQTQGPWLKGLVASNQPLAQPKGSFVRGSNLVMMERGALTPCDGSGIINWLGGAIQGNSGRFMATTLFEPTGVNPYYLAIKQALDQHLGAPVAISATPSSGGGLANGATYYYKITALDGVGGETVASNEISGTPSGGNLSLTLVWNVVPNAFGYNVYRSNSAGTELLLTGGGLPKIQPNPLTGTVSYIDTGAAVTTPITLTIVSAIASGSPGHPTNDIDLVVSTTFSNSLFGQIAAILGNSNSALNVDGATITTIRQPNGITLTTSTTYSHSTTGTGGSLFIGGSPPPVADTTQQTVLFQMPGGSIPVAYTDNNVVALFPASLGMLGQVPTGGTGGAGTTGPGIGGQGNSTPSGGIAGLVGPLPQFKQFTNRMCIALGNGYPPQIFSDDTGTPLNQALTGTVTSVSVSGDQVTVNVSGTPFTSSNLPAGSNVVLFPMTDATYDGVFQVISSTSGSFKIRNTNASGGASTGAFTVTTTPLISTFTPAYPAWTATTAYAAGDIIVPATQPTPNIYLTAIQAGTSGGSEPAWTSNVGDQFADATVLWQVTALLNSAAPPPPGAAHIEVYAGSLWAFNTSPTNTSNGLDGPCSIRMSNVNNPTAWNPINQAFLDKDDGSEGMGMGKFTITAQGIPPEGSLIAFKYRVPYQIIGVFGANNFAIQPVSSDMGCLAPRSIVFVPGYGLMRYTHLGIAVFDGWKDQVVSEQIRPYLFPVNDLDTQDIVVADANYLPLAWAAQTANPPMYAFAMPIGSSGGQLTRMMLYDLVLKCWAAPVDLPFAIGCLSQVQPVTSNPLTIIGGFSDGCLQRWQAGDVQWYTGAPASALNVAWNVRPVTVASQNSSQRVWARMLIVRGTNSGAASKITVQPRVSTVAQSAVTFPIAASGDFDVFASIGLTGLRFDAIISGSGHVEIDGVDWAIEPRPFGVPVSAI